MGAKGFRKTCKKMRKSIKSNCENDLNVFNRKQAKSSLNTSKIAHTEIKNKLENLNCKHSLDALNKPIKLSYLKDCSSNSSYRSSNCSSRTSSCSNISLNKKHLNLISSPIETEHFLSYNSLSTQIKHNNFKSKTKLEFIFKFIRNHFDYLIIFTFSFLLYSNTLNAGFVYDDSRAIKKNQDLRPDSSILDLFRNDFWGTRMTHSGSHKSYRPLCVLTYRLNYYLHGLNAEGYHLFNVIINCLVCVLYTHLIKRLVNLDSDCLLSSMKFCNLKQALMDPMHLVFNENNPIHKTTSNYPCFVHLAAGLLFTVHPIHTEPVASLVGRADLGCALFYILSMICYINYLHQAYSHSTSKISSLFYLYISLICAAIAMLFKEYGITVLLVNFFYHLIVQIKLIHLNQLKKSNSSFDSSSSVREQFGLFKLQLNLIFTSKTFACLRQAFVYCGLSLICLVVIRLCVNGGLSTPNFSTADNPTANNSCWTTRTLTFLYLIFFNFWLLVYPVTLSFDWSMESIPLIQTLLDVRNLFTLIFFSSLILILAKLFKFYLSLNWFPIDHLTDQDQDQNQFINYKSINAQNNLTEFNLEQELNLFNLFTFSIILIILPFLPATNLFFYVGFVIAERCLYIPSMGFCFFVSLCITQAYKYVASETNRFSNKKCNNLKNLQPKTGFNSNRAACKLYRLSRIHFIHLCISSSIYYVNILLKKWRLICTFLINYTFILILIYFSFRTYVRNFDWHNEEALYRSGLIINPPKAYGNLGSVLNSKGFKAEAEIAYRKALEHRFNMADVHYNLGILMQEQGRLDEALTCYQNAIRFRPKLASAYLNMGFVYNQLNRKNEAIEMYQKCISINSEGLKDPHTHEQNRVSALFNLGKLYADNGNYYQAINVYEQALGQMSFYYQIHSIYNSLGEAYSNLGKFDFAEQAYLKALKFKPDHLPTYLAYAKLLLKINRSQEANKFYLKAKDLAPNDTSVILHYGQFLLDIREYDKASQLYLSALHKNKDNFNLVFNFANSLRLAKRNAEAEHYYREAVKLKPNEVSGHLNLGAMLHLNGKWNEAEICYLQALKLRPYNSIAKTNLAKLKHLINTKQQNKK